MGGGATKSFRQRFNEIFLKEIIYNGIYQYQAMKKKTLPVILQYGNTGRMEENILAQIFVSFISLEWATIFSGLCFIPKMRLMRNPPPPT